MYHFICEKCGELYHSAAYFDGSFSKSNKCSCGGDIIPVSDAVYKKLMRKFKEIKKEVIKESKIEKKVNDNHLDLVR